MKIALLGYGKMGKMIDEIITKEGKHKVVIKINSGNKNDLSHSLLQQADVAIDFTSPDTVLQNIASCLMAHIPLVIGTTGWYEHVQKVKDECMKTRGAIVYASNFSIGVTIFFEMNRKLAELMKNRNDYEPRITEIHHAQKKDAPSGTAIKLAEDILNHSSIKERWVNLESAETDELIILSRREGDIKGIHEVRYVSEVDEIMLRHEAFSREGFARGAIFAAEKIQGRKGFFEFRELFNEK